MAEHKEQSRSTKAPAPMPPVPAVTRATGPRARYAAVELTKILQLLLMPASGTLLDVHEQLLKGLSVQSAKGLLDRLSGGVIPKEALEDALGISERTIQRRRAAPRRALSPEQINRLFKFAEVLARTTQVFGSEEAAEAWLSRPAMGLNRQRPIDLLATSAGVELVERFLGRLEYGVYT
jgi:putative toxin-antitoxin system antitoxin component (TIGR02293 family)